MTTLLRVNFFWFVASTGLGARVLQPSAPFLESGCKKWGTVPESLGLSPTCFREANIKMGSYPATTTRETERQRDRERREREREEVGVGGCREHAAC